jgi:endonuclease/exonuclease/phosphatase family metal-dependent hydrolase
MICVGEYIGKRCVPLAKHEKPYLRRQHWSILALLLLILSVLARCFGRCKRWHEALSRADSVEVAKRKRNVVIALHLMPVRPPQEEQFGGRREVKHQALVGTTAAAGLATMPEKKGDDDRHNCFWVATYHMPCTFWDRTVMLLHAWALTTIVRDLAAPKDVPYVIAGDWNLKPQDREYKAICDGSEDLSEWISSHSWKVAPTRSTRPLAAVAAAAAAATAPAPLPEAGERDGKAASGGGGGGGIASSSGAAFSFAKSELRSAYRECNGKEPHHTAHSQTKGSPCFTDTIDYIFVSRHWRVTETLALPSAPAASSYPCATQGSDHCMIAATIKPL